MEIDHRFGGYRGAEDTSVRTRATRRQVEFGNQARCGEPSRRCGKVGLSTRREDAPGQREPLNVRRSEGNAMRAQ